VPITEVFPNPTVKQVVFQIRFPSLFYLENRMGDLQMKVMREFPEASILYEHQVVLGGVLADQPGRPEPPQGPDAGGVRRIWQFRSPKGYHLAITTDSLSIKSEHHKTYRNEAQDRFRDTIENVLPIFFELAPVPVLSRVGLRYIDDCPIPGLDNQAFRTYYDSAFPLDRFELGDTEEMVFRATITKGDHHLRYVEALRRPEGEDQFHYVLDFDAYSRGVSQEGCLPTTDVLHDLISDEWQRTIKEPVYKYMRGEAD
jgi:uncharacterized protein (TIGR04255 family)